MLFRSRCSHAELPASVDEPSNPQGRFHLEASIQLVAQSQTAGRGRQGKVWASAANASLTFSLAVQLQRDDLSGLSLAVGVALAQALDPRNDRSGRARLVLKWPNDLWLTVGQAAHKLGGVLIETQGVEAQRWVVIGVGLNVCDWDAPADLKQGLASVATLDPQATPERVLAQVAPGLIAATLRFDADGLTPFAAAFAARDLLYGQDLQTSDADAAAGVGDGVDSDGALRLRTPRGLKRVRSGEVSVRWAAPADRLA